MYLTKELYLGAAHLQDSIKENIGLYLRDLKIKCLKEDISIDHIGNIEVSWEETTGCNCHPITEKMYREIKAADFIKWLEETGQEI